MSDFSEKLRLKGMAEEDLYFARKDRELIAAIKLRAEADRRRAASASGSITLDVNTVDSNSDSTRWQAGRQAKK